MPRKKLSKQELEARAKARKSEPKDKKFERIVTPRIKNVISGMRVIKKMINSNAYIIPEEKYNKIYNYIHEELESWDSSFSSRNKTSKKEEIDIDLNETEE